MSKRLRSLAFTFSVLVLSPVFFVANVLRRRKDGPLRILVIPQLTRIGDIVCSTPVFRAIKIAYPDCRLVVLSSKKAMGVIAHNPRIDEIIDVSLYSWWSLARRLSREGFDWSFDLTGVSTISALTLAVGVRHRIKLQQEERPVTEMLTDWLNTRRFLYQHRSFLPAHYVNMLAPLDIVNAPLIKEVYESPGGPRKATTFLAEHSVSSDDFVIGLSITAGNKIKEWGDERFVELMRRIVVRQKDAVFVIIGAASDEPRILEVIREAGQMRVYPASLSLEDLPSLMKRFNLYIAVDTGPIYIAHTLGIPLIDIIGPVDPLSQPPSDEKSIQVPPDNVAPTSYVFRSPAHDANHKEALDATTVEAVIRAVEQVCTSVYHTRI